MRIKCFLAVLVLALASPALAHDVPGPVEKVSLPFGTGQLPYQRLFEAVSEPGEPLDAFVVRVAPKLRAFTDETGYEACASVATDGERFGVVVGTNQGHTACVAFNAKRPEGMLPTGQTLHSHPRIARYKVNPTDMLLNRAGHKRGQMKTGGEPERFSTHDYQVPGFLVTGTSILHQAGKGTERTVGTL